MLKVQGFKRLHCSTSGPLRVDLLVEAGPDLRRPVLEIIAGNVLRALPLLLRERPLLDRRHRVASLLEDVLSEALALQDGRLGDGLEQVIVVGTMVHGELL